MLGLGYRKRFRTKKASGKRTHKFEPKLAKDHTRAECLERRLAAAVLPLSAPPKPQPAEPEPEALCVLRLRQFLETNKALVDTPVPAADAAPGNAPHFDETPLAELLEFRPDE